MSTFIKIPGVNPPSTRPRVDQEDGLLPDAGALMLYDASHPLGAWPAGAANGLVIPNIAAEQAIKLTGSRLDSTLVVGIPETINASRTAKRGLRASPPAVAPLTNGVFVKFDVPTALNEYIHRNPTHSYYVSQWHRTDRKTVGAGVPLLSFQINAGSTSYLAGLHLTAGGAGSYPDAGPQNPQNLLGRRLPTIETGKPSLHNMGVSAWSGELPAAASAIKASPWFIGLTSNVYVNPGAGIVVPDMTIYRVYMEDLTVSKRTYAQADALDYALYQKEVETAGGRYYGDS